MLTANFWEHTQVLGIFLISTSKPSSVAYNNLCIICFMVLLIIALIQISAKNVFVRRTNNQKTWNETYSNQQAFRVQVLSGTVRCSQVQRCWFRCSEAHSAIDSCSKVQSGAVVCFQIQEGVSDAVDCIKKQSCAFGWNLMLSGAAKCTQVMSGIVSRSKV